MKSTFRNVVYGLLVAAMSTVACADWTSAYGGGQPGTQNTFAPGLAAHRAGAGVYGTQGMPNGYPQPGFPQAGFPQAGFPQMTPTPPVNYGSGAVQAGMTPVQPAMPYGTIQASATMAATSPAATMPAAGVPCATPSYPGMGAGCSTGPVMTTPMMAMPAPVMPTGRQFAAGFAAGAASGRRNAPSWFGGIYGLVMNRDENDQRYFLTDPTFPDRSYLSTSDADMEFAGGYEVRLGHTFAKGCWGLEFVYWELFPNEQFAITTLAGVPAPALYGTIPYNDVYLPASTNLISTDFRDGNINAARLDRDWKFQNIEVNLISRPLYAGNGIRAGRPRSFGPGFAGAFGGGGTFGGPVIGAGMYGPSIGGGGGCSTGACASCGDACGTGSGGCGCASPYYDGTGSLPCGPAVGGPLTGGVGGCPPRLHIGWGFGVRYFRFDEDFLLSYDTVDSIWDGADPTTEFYHDIDVDNDLVGVQMALNTDYYLSKRLHLEAGTKFGFYANHFSVQQSVYDDTGFGYTDIGGTQYETNVNVDDEDIAFLGELRLGLGYRIGCHWRLTGGYRALAASGIATATNQIPFGNSWTDRAGYQDVNRNGDLILHGAYGGLEFAW